MNKKSRYWTFLVYPESAPEDWESVISVIGIPFAVSPLHDKDLNADGEAKKAHYHVIGCWDGPTTFKNVSSLTEALNSPIPQPISSVKGAYRYLTHTDNPEKYQYSSKDIRHFNGFDPTEMIPLTKTEMDQMKITIQKMIEVLNIYEYCDLMDYLLQNELYEEWSIASNNTFFFDKYISSRRNKKNFKDK